MKPRFVYSRSNRWECPESLKCKNVIVFFRNGVVSDIYPAEALFWEKQGVPSDIIAYRVIGEEK